jgi:hypothetical protein
VNTQTRPVLARGEPPEGPRGTPREQPGAPALDEERAVRCRRCGHELARLRDREPLDGAATRSFVNPHGLVFEIAAFRAAAGCAAEGEPSSFWTWFPGHAWQLALCGRCAAHVGWRFTGPSTFYGLLLDRIEGA